MFAKVKYLLAIGFLFLIPACVTGQATGASTVDIDATVEARLALIPTPTPQIITQEVEVIKEVIVEKEVPVIKEVVVESEVIKEVVIEVPKEVEVVKEITVEKIVQVVVTATPTPKPTAIPTATPIPVPTYKASDFVVVTRSQAETKILERKPTGTVTEYNIKYPFIDILVTNTHPSLAVRAYLHEKIVDDKGSYIRNFIGGHGQCIFPNETQRFRYDILKLEDDNGNKKSIDVLTRFEHESTNEWINAKKNYSEPTVSCESAFTSEINESLLDKVEIDLSKSEYLYDFSINIRNNSDYEIIWAGEYKIIDDYGNVIYRNLVGLQGCCGTIGWFEKTFGSIKPNFKESVHGATWYANNNPNPLKYYYYKFWDNEVAMRLSDDDIKATYTSFFPTDLKNIQASLKTIILKYSDGRDSSILVKTPLH